MTPQIVPVIPGMHNKSWQTFIPIYGANSQHSTQIDALHWYVFVFLFYLIPTWWQ